MQKVNTSVQQAELPGKLVTAKSWYFCTNNCFMHKQWNLPANQYFVLLITVFIECYLFWAF